MVHAGACGSGCIPPSHRAPRECPLLFWLMISGSSRGSRSCTSSTANLQSQVDRTERYGVGWKYWFWLPWGTTRRWRLRARSVSIDVDDEAECGVDDRVAVAVGDGADVRGPVQVAAPCGAGPGTADRRRRRWWSGINRCSG